MSIAGSAFRVPMIWAICSKSTIEFEGPFRAVRSVDESRKLAPSLMSFEQWLVKNKSRIELEEGAAAKK